VRRQCRNDRGGLRRGRLDAGGDGRPCLVADGCNKATAHRGAALAALGSLVPGHPPQAGTEVRVLRKPSQLRPCLDLFLIGIVWQLRGHRAPDALERGLSAQVAEDGVEEIADQALAFVLG
jgi:hypothetical protein